MSPPPAACKRLRLVGIALVVALPAVFAGCGDGGTDPDSGGAASLSDSYYSASNLEPALNSIGSKLGEKATVELTVTQDSVKATGESKRGGAEAITVPSSGSGGAVPASGPGKVAGPELDDIDPETVQQLVSEVADQANVDEDNVTSISTLSATGTDAGWSIALDDGSRWKAALDGSDLRMAG